MVQRNNLDEAEVAKDKVFEVEGSSTSKSVALKELNGDKRYDVIVQARTSKGLGQKSSEGVYFDTPITCECPN